MYKSDLKKKAPALTIFQLNKNSTVFKIRFNDFTFKRRSYSRMQSDSDSEIAQMS